jgi:glycerate-2-kinase
MSVADEVELFKRLTALAAPIQDVNIVRKHISRVRGGALAVAAYPAEVVSLLVSDVPGDDIEFIASGPTIRDVTTVSDAQEVLAKYNITAPVGTTFLETAKESKYFERVTNTLLLSSRDALEHMTQEAIARGYGVQVVDTHFTGEARDIGRAVVERLHESAPKTALLYAGESTVTLNTTMGNGGRDQEMALATLDRIKDDELILPFASDGHDFTEHAGAIGDALTRTHAAEKNISIAEHLDAHRSHNFFEATNDALVTGYTGSNVSDLIIALKS